MTAKHDLPPSNPPSETTSDELTKPNTGLYDSEFWAVSRHELIADVAEQLLKPGTAERIRELLSPNGEKFNVTWEGKHAYDARCKPIALDRMKSSARNLALLLDAIYA